MPDDWNGLPVNFQTTFLNTVTCADAFGADPCDPSPAAGFDLELWGLPTSLPTLDPLNPDFVYQRFQRGIMHFSRTTGLTQGLLLGDWFKRVMIGVDLSPDLERRGAPVALLRPVRPLAAAGARSPGRPARHARWRRPSAPTRSTAAGQASQTEPTLPPNVAQTATAVAMTATAITATQVALTGHTGAC